MMLKKIIFLLSLTLIIGCGYTPIHSLKNSKEIGIKNILFSDGDRKLNISLDQSLRRLKSNKSENLFDLTISSKYEKETISKDTTGAPSKYQLKAEVEFIVKFNNKTEIFRFEEFFIMDHSSDDFENLIYEDSIKQNFANSFAQKLISALSQLL